MSFPEYDKSVLRLNEVTREMVQRPGYQLPKLHYDDRQVGGFAGAKLPAGEVVDGRQLVPGRELPQHKLIRAIISPSEVQDPEGERSGQLFFTVLGSTLKACCQLEDMGKSQVDALRGLGIRRLAVDFVYNMLAAGAGRQERQGGTPAPEDKDTVTYVDRIYQVGIRAVHGVEQVFNGEPEPRPNSRPSIVLEGMVIDEADWDLKAKDPADTVKATMVQVAFDRHNITRTIWVPLTQATNLADNTEALPQLDEVIQIRVSSGIYRHTYRDEMLKAMVAGNYFLPEHTSTGRPEASIVRGSEQQRLVFAEKRQKETAGLIADIAATEDPAKAARALEYYIVRRTQRDLRFFSGDGMRHIENLAISAAEKQQITAAFRAKRWPDGFLPVGLQFLREGNTTTVEREHEISGVLQRAGLLAEDANVMSGTVAQLTAITLRVIARRLHGSGTEAPHYVVQPGREEMIVLLKLLPQSERQAAIAAVIEHFTTLPDIDLFAQHVRQLVAEVYHSANQQQRIKFIKTMAAAITGPEDVYLLAQDAYEDRGWSGCVLDIMMQDLEFAVLDAERDGDPYSYAQWQEAASALLKGLAQSGMGVDELPMAQRQRDRLKRIQHDLQVY